ncbi:hypothetical protein K438DRAFT_1559562, partial [Mycena galopus ATCC 62051]
LPLPVVSAIVRLGHKYDFKSLFDLAVACLTSEYPTTLQEYDTMPDEFKTIKNYPGVDFDMITLASENEIFSVLPCAYYCLVRAYSLLFNGIRRRDGTVAHLPTRDLRRCVVGRESLLTKQFQQGYPLGWVRKWELQDCYHSSRCGQARQTALRWYLDNPDVWALAPPSHADGFHCCTTCTRHIHECITGGREKIWKDLPGFFDLPPWSELKNDI